MGQFGRDRVPIENKAHRRNDPFTRPTNGYMEREKAKREAAGLRVGSCPGCGFLRWFTAEALQIPNPLCDLCLMEGPLRDVPFLASSGELTSRQRHKKV